MVNGKYLKIIDYIVYNFTFQKVRRGDMKKYNNFNLSNLICSIYFKHINSKFNHYLNNQMVIFFLKPLKINLK